ncbi:MAG: GTPase ObgE [Oscillospiraceae bacterium]|nr:GTPase ObgE [Oscillospiraceae bacterium]MBR6561728.1 GTPase ObgE [Oscillospiraceae bacterium]
MATQFVDKASIKVTAGRGGDGAVSFHREKYVAAGGPDGGDGGRGGDIILVVDEHMSTLMDFRYKRKYTAGPGANGSGKRCSGKDGESLTIRVPRGTLVRDRATNGIIADMSGNEPFVLAKGGRGGWGNKHFATPTRQIPRFAKPGMPGEVREVILELKLLADVGLVGFPNVGKSTLLSVVSKAHPKIANYHFTTLFPNLGVVYVDEGVSFVMADIPGIIEGASEGAGLGHDFLRHIDRCRLLVHLVDVSGSEGRDPVEDFDAICTELREYNPELAKREQIVVANKCDLLEEDNDNLARLRAHVEELGYQFFELSAVTHRGLTDLTRAIATRLQDLPPTIVYEPDYVAPLPEIGSADDVTITRYDDVWVVEGAWLERVISSVNFGDYESRMYFDRVLRESGLFERMEALGVKDGDTVSMYDLEFEYQT